MTSPTYRIIILGGGAGGLELAVRLAKAGCKDILLVDQSQTHVWKPRLHELAAGLRRGHIGEIDYAGLAEHWGFAFEQGELADIDPEAKTVTLAPIEDRDGRPIVPRRRTGYQALVLALGGVTPDLGVEGVLDHAFLLDRDPQAEALFEHFSYGLLKRARQRDDRPYQVAIVGSGATGVELAAHLATCHLSSAIAPRSALPELEVTLIEAMDTFMPGMEDAVRQSVRERFRAVGIRIETGRQVSRVSHDALETDDGHRFPADLTVWAAGRVGPPVADGIAALAVNKKRQWVTRPTLQTSNSDAIFAMGDCAYIEDDPAPPTAQAASEQSEHLADQLPRYLAGDSPAPFEYEDKGTLLSLGQAGSLGEIKGPFSDDISVRGRLARAAYGGLHRQHQYILLGATHGTAAMLSDVFGRALGPRLKVH